MNVTIIENNVALDNLRSEMHQHSTLDLSVLDSCGIITNGQDYGSCVAIRSNLMLTAGHCIGIDGTWVEVDGQQYRILKQWKSDKYDVGFAEIEGELPFVELAERDPELLDEVFLIGSPYDVLFERTITRGIISHLERHVYSHVGLIQTDAEGAPGSSGCPLFCERGRIIGICVAGPNPGGGVTLCEPVEHIKIALGEYDARGE
jgi:S1-C subfamily serine protease